MTEKLVYHECRRWPVGETQDAAYIIIDVVRVDMSSLPMTLYIQKITAGSEFLEDEFINSIRIMNPNGVHMDEAAIIRAAIAEYDSLIAAHPYAQYLQPVPVF